MPITMTRQLVFHTREEWLARRRRGIGASDAAAILGLSPWATPLSVYSDKLGLDPGPTETPRMRLGLLLEPVVVALAEEALPELAVLPAEPGFRLEVHPEHGWMLATLDRTLRDPLRGLGVLEAKATAADYGGEWAIEPPLPYQVQVQHQLAVTGRTWGVIAVLIGGAEFRTFAVERHDRFIDALVEREETFWRRVCNRQPPDPTPSATDRELLNRLYPVETGPVIALDPAFAAWDRQRQLAEAALREAQRQKDEAENFLRAAIAEAAGGVLPDGTLYSWRTVERKGYEVAATTYRQLRRKGPK